MQNIFKGLFDIGSAEAISVRDFMVCIISSLVIGLIIAVMYMYKCTYSKGFIVTLATLPAVVCAVIMMVNGNIGAGVAVAGAFSLVRFRSVPGTAKEIGVIFMAMGSGLIAGMGYIAYAMLFAVIISLVNMLYAHIGLGERRRAVLDKALHITIPEDLDYYDVFDDIFGKYAAKCELVSVKSTNMGSLFKLVYNISFKESGTEKAFIDEVRCRNGNLEVVLGNREREGVEI